MEEVGNLIPSIFKERIRRESTYLIEILTPLWSRVAGKPLAQHCRPVAFGAGTLTLATDCTSWAAQLRQMTEEIRAEINSFLGQPVVKKLRVRYEPNLEGGAFQSKGGEARLERVKGKIAGRSTMKYFSERGRRMN